MSVVGQTRSSADVCVTTASPSEADMTESPSDVAEVPISNTPRFSTRACPRGQLTLELESHSDGTQLQFFPGNMGPDFRQVKISQGGAGWGAAIKLAHCAFRRS